MIPRSRAAGCCWHRDAWNQTRKTDALQKASVLYSAESVRNAAVVLCEVWTGGSDVQRKDLAVFRNGKDTAAVLGIGIQELPGKAKILPLVHGDHAADPGQIQEVPGTPEAVLSQPGVQGAAWPDPDADPGAAVYRL